MSKRLIEIASGIIQAQASKTHMTADELSAALREVFGTLHDLQRAESGEIDPPKEEGPAPTETLTPAGSIQSDKVICLECGAEMRQLTKLHLVSHGLTAKEYKKKYGFTMSTPLAAKSLTKARSKAAKKRGVPENLKKYMEQRRHAKAEASKPAPAQSLPDSPGTARAKRVKSLFSPKGAE